MNRRVKNTIRKVIYIIIFIAMITCFIYLGNKYANDDKQKVITINDYYKNIKKDKFFL